MPIPRQAPIPASRPAAGGPTLPGNAALGLTQIILWGGSFFLPAVLVGPIAHDTGWPQGVIVGALSLAILISGLLSPWVGTRIRRHGGRPVLITGTLIMAAGLVLMALSPDLPCYVAAWTVVGFGMAGALYDPLFAAIGQAYGSAARGAMTQIAIASGFAVTVCWPATRLVVDLAGWRVACLAYAGLSALVVAPIFALALPRVRGGAPVAIPGVSPPPPAARGPLPGERILSASFTFAAVLMASVSVTLLLLLQSRGIPAGSAVALSALIGPAQVGARVLELAFGRRAHPIHLLLISSGSVALGLVLLALAPPSLAWLAIVLYGAGNGMRTVVRGTLPLALYGQEEYAAVIGRLARPPLLGQAAAPLVCGTLAEHLGAEALLGAMLAVAALNTGLSVAVARRAGRSTAEAPS